MSRTTTTTPDSRKEITDPKKRPIDPEEQKSIDRVDALFKNIIPSPPPEPQNPIAVLSNSYTIKRLAQKLVISVELAQKTKQILSEIPKCEEGVQEFSNAMREIWPCLTTGILGAMNSEDVIGIIVRYANRDSATQRWASMKADPSFEPFLKKLESASKGSKKKKESASYFGIMRLFLCILIGYWGDKDELPKLDAAIGRPDGFLYRMTMLEYFRKEENKPRPIKRVDSFSYTIKDADDAKNMEMVQNWLVSKYRDDKNVDREALLEETRATPDSSREISDSKRIDLKVLNKDLDIDRVRAFLRSIPPSGPPLVERRSPIDMLMHDYAIWRLAKVLVNSQELVEKAKAAIQILKDGILNPDQGTNAVREFWLSGCFVKGLRTTQEKHAAVVCPILHFANEDPAQQRWKLMKEDPLFKPSLTSLDSDFDIMRLFLSILIGYWANKAELTKLDAAMGKDIFGRMMTIQALAREKEKKKKNGVEEEVKNYMYFIKDADDAKNLKHVQEWLVSEYGNDKNVDTYALSEEIESTISLQVKINQEAGLYNGKIAKIVIYIQGGCDPLVSMECKAK